MWRGWYEKYAVPLALILGLITGCTRSLTPDKPAAEASNYPAASAPPPQLPSQVTQSAAGGSVIPQVMFDEQTGWGWAGQQLVITSDGGFHWTTVPLPGSCQSERQFPRCSAFFFSTTAGWVMDMQEESATVLLYNTVDGGQHWSQDKVVSKFHGEGGWSIWFLDKDHGWLQIGTAGHIINTDLFRTTDGGKTWQHLPAITGGNVQFQDTTNGWMNGSNITVGRGVSPMYKTTDGGQSWQNQRLPVPKSLADYLVLPSGPVFLTRQDAILPTLFLNNPAGIEQHGSFITHDGGETWAFAPDLTFSQVFTGGWAISKDGILYRSRDGGRTWQKVQTNTRFEGGTWRLLFVNKAVGWAVSVKDSGVQLLKTTNEGTTWETVLPETAS